MNKIRKLLSVGDTVYSAANGKPMMVSEMGEYGFTADEEYFEYDEVRKLYYLTKKVMSLAKCDD